MKKSLLCLILLVSFTFACGGSCIQCHSILESIITDKDHHVLTTCIDCHNKPSQNGQCGKDCFDCHDKGKLYADASVNEHQAIKQCYTCHKDHTDLITSTSQKSVSSTNRQKPLIEILK